MESIKQFTHRKLDGFTIDDYVIIFASASIFFPYVFTIAAMLIVIAYLAFSRKLRWVMTSVPKAKYIYIFLAMIFGLSIINGNMLGALCTIGIFVIFITIFYYRLVITKRLFEFIMDACCIVSWLCVLYAVVEYYHIAQALQIPFFEFTVVDSPIYRINSTFFNANYYAMMIEFLILICIYKMMKVRSFRRVAYYVITILSNLFALYLSGCRTAWAPFLVTIPLMFFLNRKKLYFRTTMGIYGITGITLLINPDLFPRIDSLVEYFYTRVDIWTAALRGIMQNPFFGKGPLTYYFTYETLGGPPTQHAHSVFLDPFLSFGIIPLIFLCIYLYAQAKEIWHLYSRKYDLRLFSLVIGFILTVLLHGTFDYTIFWIQTAMLFFVVISSTSIYEKKNYKA